MKRWERAAAVLVLTMLLGLLGGCGQMEKTAETENGGPVPLTEEEIGQVNKAFVPFFEEDGMVRNNPLCCLVSCYYEKPEDIDLSVFLAYSFVVERGPDWEPVGEEEFQTLREQADWLGESREEWRTPIGRIPRAQVDAFLEKYTGITTAELAAPWAEKEFIYLEEYDAYYNFTSDFDPGWFEYEEGVRDGDIVRLTGYGQELTLEKQPDSSWHFVSFLPVEEAGA